MIYLLTLLCQTKIGGLPTNYFKTDELLKEINKNLVLASENPVMDYDELNMPAYMRRDYLE